MIENFYDDSKKQIGKLIMLDWALKKAFEERDGVNYRRLCDELGREPVEDPLLYERGLTDFKCGKGLITHVR